jgi:hypothetical protein
MHRHRKTLSGPWYVWWSTYSFNSHHNTRMLPAWSEHKRTFFHRSSCTIGLLGLWRHERTTPFGFGHSGRCLYRQQVAYQDSYRDPN